MIWDVGDDKNVPLRVADLFVALIFTMASYPD